MDYVFSLSSQTLFFLLLTRVFLIGLWILFITFMVKKDSHFYLLGGIIIAGSLSIIIDMSFLKGGYALWPDGSGDRFPYLAQAMTYAAGNPLREDPLYKNVPTMFSPLFPYILG